MVLVCPWDIKYRITPGFSFKCKTVSSNWRGALRSVQITNSTLWFYQLGSFMLVLNWSLSQCHNASLKWKKCGKIVSRLADILMWIHCALCFNLFQSPCVLSKQQVYLHKFQLAHVGAGECVEPRSEKRQKSACRFVLHHSQGGDSINSAVAFLIFPLCITSACSLSAAHTHRWSCVCIFKLWIIYVSCV